jgi:type VI secretion system protein ImpK
MPGPAALLPAPAPEPVQEPVPASLGELLGDGIHLLSLVRAGASPWDAAEFPRRVDAFLAQFDRQAAQAGKAPEAILDARFAFCALLDEAILSSDSGIREDWERAPLQLRHFGEHLAGEGFFRRLDLLRQDPARNLEVLEVFLTCLLLGFQGKYLLEGGEKLQYLILRLDQELSQAKGGKAAFAPRWQPPLRSAGRRQEPTVRVFFAVLALVGLLVYLLYAFLLRGQARELAPDPSRASAARRQPSVA